MQAVGLAIFFLPVARAQRGDITKQHRRCMVYRCGKGIETFRRAIIRRGQQCLKRFFIAHALPSFTIAGVNRHYPRDREHPPW